MSSTKAVSAAYRPDHDMGVVVPFTTPQFTGARLRVNRKGRFELVLRNPAGGKGVYLVELEVAHRFSAISLHDRILHAELLKLLRVSPRAVRLCARRVALWGAAGHGARLAAQTAARKEEQRVARLRDHLLGCLSPASGGERPRANGEAHPRPATAGHDLDERTLREAAEEIAAYGVGIGLPPAIPSFHAETLNQLAELADALDSWGREGSGRSVDIAAEVARLARETHAAAGRELERRQRELAEGRALLARWRADRVGLLEDLQICDWLLDGWPDRCALWNAAPVTDRACQRAALRHIAKLLPPAVEIEREACHGDEAIDALRRALRESTDWRDEVRLAEILERQEALRAELAA